MRTPSIALAVLLLASGCGERTVPARGARSADLDAYCAVAGQSGLDAWIGDVVTLCSPADDDDGASCRALRARADGSLDPIALPEGVAIVRAMPAGARIVALLTDGRLVAIGSSGVEPLAGWAGDPWIDEDGARVVYVALADGVTEWELGAPTVIRALELESGSSTVIVDDADASAPRTIPGSRDVLFTSTRTGIASLWIARESGALEALTNVDAEEMSPDVVPVPDREIAFVDGTLVYSVATEEPGPRLWALDLGTRAARELGSGAWPRASDRQRVIALQTEGECAAVLPVGGAR